MSHQVENDPGQVSESVSDRGIDQLKQLEYQGQKSELYDHAPSLEEAFREQPPRSSGEAQARIEEMTGVKRSPTQIRAFMTGLGWGYRKVGYVPGRADDPVEV